MCVCTHMQQLLGCVELSRMAKYSRPKRHQVFCLTTLGAQPVNWLNLRNVCLIQLTRFVDLLNSYRGLAVVNGHSIAGQYCSAAAAAADSDDDDDCVAFFTISI